MAHIFDIAPLIDTGYIDGKKVGNQVKYPNTGTFSGFNKPFRLEGDIFDLEVTGTIPPEINGTFYRVQPDHRFPPVFEDDIHFNGDGNITAIRIQNGHADYKQRYVRTDRFLAETKECRTHPKFDPETGKIICFAYEAGGNGNDGSRQIAVWTIDANGIKTEEAWYEAPFCGMIHDCGISKNYIVLPMTPLKCNPDRLQKGGNHWAWDPKEDQYSGLTTSAFHGHVAGCYENEDGNIVFDLTVADGNVFFFFPPEDTPAGTVAKRNRLNSPTKRWIFNPKGPSGTRVQASEE
ncbi:hypothetical protein IL306_004149 [Fusarium sp. DS 682]|nr:hypothetical protein IL306_004149 [Fusarium sp. DS 682]